VSPRRANEDAGEGQRARGARLKEYRAKRDFDATSEPSGAKRARKSRSPRFVIHEHSATRLHWDLRLERDGVLASWAVPKGIPEQPKENHLAVWTEDHPLEYVDFNGEIPKGQYGAGTMTIWDSGTYDVLKWEPRKIEVALHGERVDARYALFPISSAPAEGERPKEWMIHRMDPPADAAREPMPEHVKPMLARPGSLPRKDDGWAYEIKWDGVRAIAYSTPGELRLESRFMCRKGGVIAGKEIRLSSVTAGPLSVRPVIIGIDLQRDAAQGRPVFRQAHEQGGHLCLPAHRAQPHDGLRHRGGQREGHGRAAHHGGGHEAGT